MFKKYRLKLLACLLLMTAQPTLTVSLKDAKAYLTLCVLSGLLVTAISRLDNSESELKADFIFGGLSCPALFTLSLILIASLPKN